MCRNPLNHVAHDLSVVESAGAIADTITTIELNQSNYEILIYYVYHYNGHKP
jgi:hypothetical protein